MPGSQLVLNLRSQTLSDDGRGRKCWKVVQERRKVASSKTAILICDMWDDHTCPAAAERVAEMAPRLNEVLSSARGRGVRIIHSPSDTVESFYADHPARKLMLEVPQVEPPAEAEHPDPPKPIHDTESVCDTVGHVRDKSKGYPWTRQHEAIEICDEDVISDKGNEVYSFLRHEGIEQFIICGVHTNMCILHRTFGIKRMVRLGVKAALVRDFTDAMYDPAVPPYVSHDEGTRLVVDFIEKFWCPTISSRDLL